jgi:Flp pilus assembly pilin Flp
MNVFSRALRDDTGATMVEYAVIVALIAAVCTALVVALGGSTSAKFSSFNSQMGSL